MGTWAGREGTLEWDGLRTWYRVVGDLAGSADRSPVVVCHGGPGLTHDYLTSVAELSRSGRPCVFYDQVGNGRSSRGRDKPAEFWTVDLFVRELQALVEHLGIADAYHVVGHSWGGMLALELALRHPRGLRSLVVASAFASAARYSAEVAGLVRDLPADTLATIRFHEAAGSTDTAEYQEALRVFYGRHVCRVRPVPDEVRRTLALLGEDSTVYQAMAGPNEFHLTGALRDWDITDRLHSVDVPLLLISGRHDEVTPAAVVELFRGLAGASWAIFEESSHMPHVEQPARFLAVVEEFLDRTEAVPAPADSGAVDTIPVSLGGSP